jgi:protein-S-isoprenylcysteine O-methyltransferase Ste14
MNKVKQVALGIVLISMVAAPVLALAQVSPVTSLAQVTLVINKILATAQTILFAVAGIFIIWAGFTYLGAGGDPEKTNKAKNQLVYAIIAIVIGLLAAGVSLIIREVIEK